LTTILLLSSQSDSTDKMAKQHQECTSVQIWTESAILIWAAITRVLGH